MLTPLFWFSAAFVFYAYVGYPLALLGFSRVLRRVVRKGDITPRVSLIITAHNEERVIEAKIQNTLALVYPKTHLEMIVASDCSSDRTDDIVRSHAAAGVRLVRAPQRLGKENAQRHAIEAATGEICVFSDAGTSLAPDGIAKIVRNFNDPTVGCVSSVDRFMTADGKMTGEGAYVQYEMRLREWESRVGSLVGLSGSFFAARRGICHPWAVDLPSDFHTVLNAIRHGLRGVSDPESIGYYRDVADAGREFNRKVRTVSRGLSVLIRHPGFLNPFQYGLFAWQIFSHKLCRWLVPFFLIAALISNGLLLSCGTAFRLFFLIQCLFYAAAGAARVIPFRLARIPYYFVVANLAILVAWYRYLFLGGGPTTWAPSRR